MSEHVTEMTAHRVNYVCDSCGEGFMRPTNAVLMSDPPQYPHRCSSCDTPKTFRVLYPRIEYRPAKCEATNDQASSQEAKPYPPR